jgi:periplasmic copper chaperone A
LIEQVIIWPGDVMNYLRSITAFAAATILSITACGAPAANSNITVTGAWAESSIIPAATPDNSQTGVSGTITTTNLNETGVNGPVSGAYLTISNTGGKADRLVSIISSVANVAEVHETVVLDGGMMGMRLVQGGLEIPAHGSVALTPGRYHIMMMDLKQQLVAGQTITLSLRFQSGKQIDVDVPVKSIADQ